MTELLKELALLMEMRIPLLLLVAAICGALVGLEREHSAKPAGLRTNMMICVGSALFTIASIISAQQAGNPGDASRITAQIVSGVGFIGAGAILRSGFRITGLTTAATIWLVAGIGIIVGLGLPALGLLVSSLSALVLLVLGKFEFSSFPQNHERPSSKD